ncbi:SDR family oxidoreductase [Candidatus Shapirobacteria bacterium]|nr:SDR family oxidoreductase [Candidatus Shapirobacteria bacterium]
MTNTPFNDLLSLASQTAIVTGGALGIGLGITTRLAQAGANVVIADINEESGTKASADLNAQGYKTAFIKTDVSLQTDVDAAVKFATTTFGSLNILVNNAGIYPNTPVMDMDIAVFEKIINVNLKSVFMLTKSAAAVMIQQGKGGKIVNITSIDALHPSGVGLAAYDSSKHGLWGFTKNVALELAPHNITVNAVAPGGISTPGTGMGSGDISPAMKELVEKFTQKIPMKKFGDPDDIGKVVLFLASDMSSYMTGSQIVVDGGVLLS